MGQDRRPRLLARSHPTEPAVLYREYRVLYCGVMVELIEECDEPDVVPGRPAPPLLRLSGTTSLLTPPKATKVRTCELMQSSKSIAPRRFIHPDPTRQVAAFEWNY